MRIEIRDDSVVVDGYVNAVERDSKVLKAGQNSFVEKVKAGVFRRALDRAKEQRRAIKILLNHNYDRVLAETGDGNTTLTEDAIGLRCRCEIRDAEIVKKAKEKKLAGWSFGFLAIRETWDTQEPKHRELRDIELREVSLLDDTRIPAYDGTSVEVRAVGEDLVEQRWFEDDTDFVDTVEKKADNYEYENRYLAVKVL